MSLGQRALFVCYVGMAVVVSGCDGAPNPAFEKKMNDLQRADPGDPYGMLFRPPIQYGLKDGPNPVDAAKRLAEDYGSAYEQLLDRFKSEPVAPDVQAVKAQCQERYAAIQKFRETLPQDLVTAARSLSDQLADCRERALEVGKDGDDAMERQAILLRRFASFGVVLVGVVTVAHGDETEGLRIWRRGDELVADDRPGYKFRARDLLGGGG